MLANNNTSKELFWTDMHTHLDKLEEGAKAAIELAREQNIHRLITIGTEMRDLPIVLELSEKYQPEVFCTLGIHPHEGATYNQDVEDFILKNATKPRVVAVGEIGLDYYYESSPKKEQLFAFERQMELAEQLKLPVEIHTRDAEADTVEILKKFNGKVKGLIHCFTGSSWLAKECLNLGFHISISGVVTFKNAQALRDVVSEIPLDSLHVETDSPFLAPVPLRGRPNTSAYMIHTAKMISEIKKISMEELCLQTQKNAETIFPKLIS